MTSNGTAPDLPPGLLQEYLAEMQAELGVLAGIAQRLSVAGNDREALVALGRATHKIHGSAGSYGFPEASRLAAGVEATAKDWVARPDESEVDRASLVHWFVTRLAEMLGIQVAAAAPPAPPAPRVGPPPRPPKPPSAQPTQPSLRTSPRGPLLRAPAPALSARPSPQPPASPTPSTDGMPPAAPAPPRSTRRVQSPLARPVAPEAPKPEPPPAGPAGKREPAAPLGPAPAAALPAVVRKAAPPPAAPGPAAPRPATPRAPFAPRAAAPPPEQQPAPVAGPVAAVPAGAAATVPEVIVVEDDPSLAELLVYGLEARGYRFRTYRNGRDALRELLALEVGGTHPLLLLDIDLPGLDGYSIFDAIERARPGTYRVVFTTVHGTEEDQLRGLEGGALDYLIKPISLRVALEKIRRWVGR